MSVAPNTTNKANDRAEGRGEYIHAKVEETQDAMRSGLNSVSEHTRRFTDQVTQERLQKNLDDFGVLARCQSLPDVMAAQSTIMRHNLEQTIEGTRRIAEVATRVAYEAGQTLKAETKKASRVA